MFNSGISLADIAAATNRDNDGFGGGNGWWVLIILFALFGGWGNNGNNGNQNVESAVQRGFDTQAILSNLQGLEQGICSLGYDNLSQTTQLANTVTQGNFSIQQAINDASVSAMQSFNQLQSIIQTCCCENRQGQADLKYQMATDTCQITRAIENSTRDIIDSNNCNYRALSGQLTDLVMNQKDETIAALRSQLADCRMDSVLAQNANYVINAVRPTPQPTFQVNNPWAWNNNCGNGCCGNNCNC